MKKVKTKPIFIANWFATILIKYVNEVFSSAVCHIHVIARGAFDKVAKLLKTRSWTTCSLSGAVLHMAILSADLHIVILSAYWNIIWRSTYGNIIRRSASCDIICILKYYPQIWMYWNIIRQSACMHIYWNIILKSTNWNIISAAHLCCRKMQFSICNERKEEMWSSY